MHYPFELDQHHQLILRILYESQETSVNYLYRLVALVRLSKMSFSAVADHLISMNKGYSETPFWPSTDDEEILKIRIVDLDRLGLLKLHYGGRANPVGYGKITYTDEGRRIANALRSYNNIIIRPPMRMQRTVFFASAFGRDDINKLYESTVLPAAKQLDVVCEKLDLLEPSSSISQAIVDGIEKALCVVADLTYARQSVYFEIGYARGLGIPTLLICRKDHERSDADDRKVHFDVKLDKISYWWTDEDGNIIWKTGESPRERLEVIIEEKKKRAHEASA